MSFSATTIPNQYMHGYKDVPLRVVDTDVFTIGQYKYMVNITHNQEVVNTSQSVSLNGVVMTSLTFIAPHEFKVGQVIYLSQASNLYTGYYTIMQASSLSIVINLTLGAAITETTYINNCIPFLYSPSPSGDIKLDISDALRNFVTEDTQFDSNDCFAGDHTRFEYDINVGHQGQALFTFNDNLFVTGNVGFINSGMTAVTQTSFQIGDQIIIQQDLYSWNYDDNFFDLGDLGFTGSTSHNFTTGDTITITGQITAPSYNGMATVVRVPDVNSLVTSKAFLPTTPVEPGTIFGVVTPQYNTTATITNIYYTASTASTGVVIVTDVAFSEATQPIGGTIKHTDGRLTSTFNELTITGLSIYNSAIDEAEYLMTDFNKYIIKNSAYTENNITTILQQDFQYRIEPSTKSWLLFHNYADDFANGVKYVWRNQGGIVLGASFLPNISTNKRDFYAPVGINQLLASANRVDTGATLSSIVDDIYSYSIEGSESGSTQLTNAIEFKLNNDCSMFDLYHLLWKDKHGSWLSYPFKYMANISEDTEKKEYYKTSGKWDNGTFGFDSWDRGATEFYSRNRGKIKLNSGIVEEFENEIIKDLFDSSHRYIQFPDGKIYGAIITNTSLPLGDDFIEGVYNYTFDVQLVNNKIRL